ncbi:MAG: NADPH-dependent 7-cyano-7-deazaguanine reductase QueF [Gammaproteobacteria bacterium]|nr:NADPH-dependent 7-cyano-7-deazaguanine reductase QueF [Gammaproteobacteria bacterium]
MSSQPSLNLETFQNPNPERDYAIRMRMPEFTCLCPKTGQPDFATLFLEYVPNRLCLELKALKLYLWGFRDQGAYHEAVTNRILDDLVAATAPRFMRLTAVWNVRGGIYTHVAVEHRAPDWHGRLPPSVWHADPTAATSPPATKEPS